MVEHSGDVEADVNPNASEKGTAGNLRSSKTIRRDSSDTNSTIKTPKMARFSSASLLGESGVEIDFIKSHGYDLSHG